MDSKHLDIKSEGQKSFRGKLWEASHDPKLGISEQFIKSRQINDIEAFCNPKIKNLMPNPTDLIDIDEAVDAILKAKSIGIFGDYDADGITSTVMFKKFLDAAKINSYIYIPNRVDGYGASEVGINYLISQGIDLLVFLDCGSTSVDLLNSIKIPICIIDHHQALAIPKVVAVVNPHRADSNSADVFKKMCTANLVFIVLARLARILQLDICMSLLDLGAIGIIGDVMPLTGFNKACVKRGLELINRDHNLGIAILASVLELKRPITATTLGFYIIPCLNAAGRVSDANIAFNLLVSHDADECFQIAKTLKALNAQRRDIENTVMLQAIEQINANDLLICARSEDWHPGVVGIVAGRLKEQYSKTAFVLYKSGELWKGSARSYKCDVGKLIQESIVEGLAESGGGHMAAGGVSIHVDNLDKWREWMNLKLKEIKMTDDIVLIDATIQAELQMNLIVQIATFGPFGAGNPHPRLILQSVWLRDIIEGNGYLRCVLHSGRTFIGFNNSSKFIELLKQARGKYIDLLLTLDESGSTKIDDARLSVIQ